MSQKEAKRAQILDMLKEDKIGQQEAARRMGVSTRQARRLSERYLREGLAGLASKKRGRASNNRLDETIRATTAELIGAHYRDFGPTLACEKLAGLHGIRLSVESVRQLMVRAGYWKLAYSVMDKPRRQSPVADGKSVNARVDKAMARRNTGHKPAPDHPWRNMPVGKSAHGGQCATS